jgi:hypothetical protein
MVSFTVLAGMISLEASAVVYLLQGYVASGRQVRCRAHCMSGVCLL